MLRAFEYHSKKLYTKYVSLYSVFCGVWEREKGAEEKQCKEEANVKQQREKASGCEGKHNNKRASREPMFVVWLLLLRTRGGFAATSHTFCRGRAEKSASESI